MSRHQPGGRSARSCGTAVCRTHRIWMRSDLSSCAPVLRSPTRKPQGNIPVVRRLPQRSARGQDHRVRSTENRLESRLFAGLAHPGGSRMLTGVRHVLRWAGSAAQKRDPPEGCDRHRPAEDRTSHIAPGVQARHVGRALRRCRSTWMSGAGPSRSARHMAGAPPANFRTQIVLPATWCRRILRGQSCHQPPCRPQLLSGRTRCRLPFRGPELRK